MLLDQGEVFLGSDHRTGVAGQSHHRKDAEHGVDGAPLESEVAEVGAREQGAVGFEQLGGRAPTFSGRALASVEASVLARLRWWLLTSRLEL